MSVYIVRSYSALCNHCNRTESFGRKVQAQDWAADHENRCERSLILKDSVDIRETAIGGIGK